MGVLQKAARYSAVSIVTMTVTQFVLMVLQLSMSPTVANVWAVSIAAVPGYLLNRRWVWGVAGDHSLTREVVPFWASALIGLLWSTVLVGVVAAAWDSPYAANAANLFAFGSLWVAKFVWLDRLLFAPARVAARVSARR